MTNKNYINGASRERRIVNKLKAKGLLANRSAGSHSIWDLVAVDRISKKIYFIQSKPKSMSNRAKDKINKKNNFLNDEFMCSFQTVSTVKELKL